MGFQEHQHPHAPERDEDLAARAVLQGRDKVPLVARWAASVGVGFGILLASAAGINSGVNSRAICHGSSGAWRTDLLVLLVGEQNGPKRRARHQDGQRRDSRGFIHYQSDTVRTFLSGIRSLCSSIIQPSLDRDTGKDILTELNTLIAQSRKIDAYRSNLVAAVNAESADALVAQREELRSRLSRTTDATAQSAIEQSIELIDSRCRVAETLRPSLERVEAQQEVIRQTLASVQSSLARMKVAPAALAAPDLAVIQASISDVTGQTRAVEEAVQEEWRCASNESHPKSAARDLYVCARKNCFWEKKPCC